MDMLYLSARPDARTGGDLSLGYYCGNKTVNEVVPAAAGAIPRQRRLHRRPRRSNYVASSQTLEKYQDKTVILSVWQA